MKKYLSLGSGLIILGFFVFAGSVLAATTGSLSATTPGYIAQWSIQGGGLVSGNCNSNYITTSTTNDRSSFSVSLSTIPDGSTITSVSVSTTDRESPSSPDGTYKTFARLNGVNTDASANLTATSNSGCTTRGPQTLNVVDTVKSGATTLEIGVIKTSTDTSGVRIGSVTVVITYTPAQYTITSSVVGNGTITPSGTTSVGYGNNLTYTSTPSAGNILSAISIDAGASSGRLNSYTFPNVTAPHTIGATFESGWSAPSSFANNNSVTNPSYVYSSNNQYSVFNDQNDQVDYSTFGLSIPVGATIDGIELAFEANRPDPRTVTFSLSTNGSTWTTGSGAKNSGTVSSTDATYVLGSSSDLWNRTWTSSDFSNLRVRVDAQSTGPGDVLNLDQLQVKVYYTLDTTPPDTSITSNPSDPTNSDSAEFTFSSTEDGTFECQIEGGGFSVCTTPKTYTGLSHGSHTFDVRAIDESSNTDPTPASYTWFVDLLDPVTTIDSATNGDSDPVSEGGFSDSSTINVNFSADGTGTPISSSECKLDSDLYSVCTSPIQYTELSDGSHTVSIRSTDTALNLESTAVFTFIVDTTAPEITLNGSTPVDVQINTVYSDAGATASDNIDGDITPNIVPTSNVNTSALGSYTVTYNVSDFTGNTATPVVRNVNVVDQENPSTTDNVPASWQNSDTTITLSCTDNVACLKVYYTTNGDNPTTESSYVDESSSWQFTVSDEGQYTIKYFGVDSSDNSEVVNTADNTLKIDKTAPTTSITSPLADSHLMGTVELTADGIDTGGSDVAKVEFWYTSISTLIGEDTSSPYSIDWDTTTVTDESHEIWSVAYDNAGNQTSSSDVSVIVDNITPVITLLGDNPKTFYSNDPYVEDGATALDAQDGDLTEDIITDSSGVDMGSYGTYYVTYDITDLAGNHTQEIRTVEVTDDGTGYHPSNQNNNNNGGEVLGAETENTGNENTDDESNTNENMTGEEPTPTTGEVLGVEKFFFTTFMKFGSKYGEVSELQKRLMAEGFYKGFVDGIFGKLLRQAVKDYQKANPPLKVDGVVGPLTRAVLNK